MTPLTLAELAAACGGVLGAGADPAAVVTGPATLDSRTVVPGGLFVALPGRRTDGHLFAADAVAAGAAAVLAARPVAGPVVLVEDVAAALARLAAAQRRALDATVVAVTGSSGKTSTKDLLAVLLGRLGPTVAPPGSYNNELGLPLTVLAATDETRYLVLEMGARHPGNIAALAALAPPDVGVVLNVGSAHIGEFGSREAIAATKGELVAALAPGALAVLNADDPLVAAMAARAAPGVRVVRTGQRGDADVRAVGVVLDASARARFTLASDAGEVGVSLALAGEHHVANALSAAAVALALGADLATVADALGGASAASRWRMEVRERADGVTVVNDAYNANPESMRAGLRTLAQLGQGRRTWAVLGEMAELGSEATAAHDGVGRLAVRLSVDRLVVVGEAARAIHTGACLEGSYAGESVFVPDPAAALALLVDQVAPGDVVLVKASRAVGLEVVAEGLLAAGGAVVP